MTTHVKDSYNKHMIINKENSKTNIWKSMLQRHFTVIV